MPAHTPTEALVRFALALLPRASEATVYAVFAGVPGVEPNGLSAALADHKRLGIKRSQKGYSFADARAAVPAIASAFAAHPRPARQLAEEIGDHFGARQALRSAVRTALRPNKALGSVVDQVRFRQYVALLTDEVDVYVDNALRYRHPYYGLAPALLKGIEAEVSALLYTDNAEFFFALGPKTQDLLLDGYQEVGHTPTEAQLRFLRDITHDARAPSLAREVRKQLEGIALEFAPPPGELPASPTGIDGVDFVYALLRDDGGAAARHRPPHADPTEFASVADALGEVHRYATGETTAAELLRRVAAYRHATQAGAVNALRAFAFFAAGDEESGVDIVNVALAEQARFGTTYVVVAWAMLWANRDITPEAAHLLDKIIPALAREGRPYLAAELADTLVELAPDHPQAASWENHADAAHEAHGYHFLNMLVAPPDPADQALALLANIAAGKAQPPPDKRVQWQLDFKKQTAAIKLQSPAKKGGWTPGRTLKFVKYLDEYLGGLLPPEEEPFAAALRTNAMQSQRDVYYYGVSTPTFAEFLYHLAGHPNAVLATAKKKSVAIQRGEPSLSVHETDAGIRLAFRPAHALSEYAYEAYAKTDVTAYKLTAEELSLSRAIGGELFVPAARKPELERALPGLRERTKVNSVLDLKDSDLERVVGGTRLLVTLLPNERAYDVEALVEPLPGAPYRVVAGEGVPAEVVTVDPEAESPRRVIVERRLEAERKALVALEKACPSLGAPVGRDYQFRIDEPERALQFVTELRVAAAAMDLRVEYPKGERFRVTAFAKTEGLSLSIGQQRDWFGVRGQLALDEQRVLDFQQLLRHTRDSGSRFVELGDGEFAELSDELRERLRKMDGLLHERSGKAALPTLGAGAFEALVDDLDDVDFDELWTQQLDRLKAARTFEPEPPPHFEATLRDYQEEGYRWLMRLAAWGVGACLADDMGLGKTVQALAVLSSRRGEGPALVLAPASVTRNWMRETTRFAKALTPYLLASAREHSLIDEVGAGDVLMVSYGLLPYVAEELQAKPFATIVIDEAQAIKNPASQRAKAVVGLQGDFKIATTGTPIENNLTELWSLFRFLNPGLLGSREAFEGKYARPLAAASAGDDGSADPIYAEAMAVLRGQLRDLVQPFLLRRRKDSVLEELPAKTEVILEVEPTDDERALYEAMRREALAEMAEATPEQQRFLLLKQLTRLRQAACHPRLVRPKSKLRSSKLELVGETIRELLDNGHRALIFSQFVKHLKLVEAWVKDAGIPYRYLDGSTPGKQREKLVQEFQAGEAELFLISLKAGGTGLNLTAADYVLHLDPWWNPAVEDQASDRAHRMGQQRPVTVYRFVTRGTIEERIIELHADKRDLADQILAGADASAKLSVDEMVAMIEGA